jgi:hypothetical protein
VIQGKWGRSQKIIIQKGQKVNFVDIKTSFSALVFAWKRSTV